MFYFPITPKIQFRADQNQAATLLIQAQHAAAALMQGFPSAMANSAFSLQDLPGPAVCLRGFPLQNTLL